MSWIRNGVVAIIIIVMLLLLLLPLLNATNMRAAGRKRRVQYTIELALFSVKVKCCACTLSSLLVRQGDCDVRYNVSYEFWISFTYKCVYVYMCIHVYMCLCYACKSKWKHAYTHMQTNTHTNTCIDILNRKRLNKIDSQCMEIWRATKTKNKFKNI